jgi:hypothetical protein
MSPSLRILFGKVSDCPMIVAGHRQWRCVGGREHARSAAQQGEPTPAFVNLGVNYHFNPLPVVVAKY